MTPEWSSLLAYARIVAGSAGPKATIPVPVGLILKLAEDSTSTETETEAGLALLTVIRLTKHFSVAPATARGWFSRGMVDGAYRLGRKGWRAPAESLPALEARLRSGTEDVSDLGAWRRKRGRAA